MIATPDHQIHRADLLSGLFEGGKRMAIWAIRVVFSMLVVIAAGIMAIATALAGLVLAFAAILVSFTNTRERLQPCPVPARGARQGVVLNARRTSRGWRVD